MKNENLKDKYSMTLEENIFVAKRNIVDYLWKSANLEGIAITFPQTEIIYEGMSVSGLRIKDINSITNLKHAWQFILDNVDFPLDFRFISQVNKIIGEYNVVPYAGELRISEVTMGGTNWKPELPNKEKIEQNLYEFEKIENITDRALTTMLFLMRTQPFYDGNKRTSMMVSNLIMIQNGKGIISIPLQHQENFRELLIKFYESNNMSEIKNFLYQNCIDGINFSKEKDLDKNSKWEVKESNIKDRDR